VSYLPSKHSREQAKKREITKDDIQTAKAEGKMSLSIHLKGKEDASESKEEIRWWGNKLKEEYKELEMGEVIEKGNPNHRHVQMELDGIEKMGPEIKEWLQKHDYFRENDYFLAERQHCQRRVLSKLRWGEEEVVVVEGRITQTRWAK
jgi:hypothetical protein